MKDPLKVMPLFPPPPWEHSPELGSVSAPESRIAVAIEVLDSAGDLIAMAPSLYQVVVALVPMLIATRDARIGTGEHPTIQELSQAIDTANAVLRAANPLLWEDGDE